MLGINLNREEIQYLRDILCLNKSTEYAQKILKRLDRAERPIKPSSAKAKGRDFQKYVCQKLADYLGIEYDQNNDNCLIHSREMGQHGTDIVLRGWVYDNFLFDIECKNQEKISLIDWIEQSKKNNINENRNWLLIIKNKKLDPVVCMDFEKFLKIVFEVKL